MIEKINKILGDWDPIEVGSPMSMEEYKQYASKIIELIHDKKDLKSYIIQMLFRMGLEYDLNDDSQNQEIDEIVREISRLME